MMFLPDVIHFSFMLADVNEVVYVDNPVEETTESECLCERLTSALARSIYSLKEDFI